MKKTGRKVPSRMVATKMVDEIVPAVPPRQPDAATDRIAPGQELEQLQIDGVDLISEFIKLGFGHFA